MTPTCAAPLVQQTYFDRPGRSSAAELVEQAARVRNSESLLTSVLDGLPAPTCVLSEHREILVANPAAAALVQSISHRAELTGLRLGEALSCIFVANGPDGCGTARQCRHCGAGQANRKFGIRPGEYSGEVRLRTGADRSEQAVTLSIHLSPLHLNGSLLRLCSLADLTASRRREALEHIFFHDVLNTAQAVQGAAGLIPGQEDGETLDELARIVSTSTSTLVGEIEAQRDLLEAEDGTLRVVAASESAWAVVSRTADLYRHSRFAKDRAIDLVPACGNDVIRTASVHLSRCVGNLLKNALEASAPGERVTLRVSASDDEVAIGVHNAAVMPDAVQAQVFQRSFSTKAQSGRGLGTYSAHLLVTRYLGGTISFVSQPTAGTTFTIRLPRTGAEPPENQP